MYVFYVCVVVQDKVWTIRVGEFRVTGGLGGGGLQFYYTALIFI